MLVIALGVISIIYGAFVSMAQWDLKRLIAYSSVSHMGYVLLGVGAAAYAIGTPRWIDAGAMALNGAALQMFNHGISTGALFFLVGVIYERAHLRDLKMFGGLSSKLPYYYGLFAVAAFTSLGLPGLAGFWSEFFVFRGAFDIVPHLGGHRRHRHRADRGLHPVEDRAVHLPGPVRSAQDRALDGRGDRRRGARADGCGPVREGDALAAGGRS